MAEFIRGLTPIYDYNTFRCYDPDIGRFASKTRLGWRGDLTSTSMRRIRRSGLIRGGGVLKQIEHKEMLVEMH